jgi:hypothetical protein
MYMHPKFFVDTSYTLDIVRILVKEKEIVERGSKIPRTKEWSVGPVPTSLSMSAIHMHVLMDTKKGTTSMFLTKIIYFSFTFSYTNVFYFLFF